MMGIIMLYCAQYQSWFVFAFCFNNLYELLVPGLFLSVTQELLPVL
jgi:hypothetical protein